MKNKESLQTLVTLANAGELVCGIADAVLGNDVADSISGNPLTQDAVRNLAMSQIQVKLTTYRGGV